MRIPGYGRSDLALLTRVKQPGLKAMAKKQTPDWDDYDRISTDWLCTLGQVLISPGLSSHIYKMEIIIIVPSPQGC